MMKRFYLLAAAAVLCVPFHSAAQGLFEKTVYEGREIRGINASDKFDVRIVYSQDPKVVLQLTPELQDYYSMEVKGDVLGVGMMITEELRRKLDYDKQPFVVKVTVYTDRIASIAASGSATITSTDSFTGDNLDVKTGGTSRVNMKYSGRNLKAVAKGSSDITISGEFDTGELQASGSASIGGPQLKIGEAKVKNSKKSTVKIVES